MRSFERRDRKRDSTNRGRDGQSRGKPRFDKGSRDSGPREFRMTKVICSACNKECEVPFKPTSNKPLFCKECFSKDTPKTSNKEMDIINQKLDKIMKALDIK